jgi:predicted nucleotidyltransferase
MLGGSHSYGLNMPASDNDYRGVYLDTNISSIIGLNKNELQQTQNEKVDEVMTEFRHTLRLLRQANTQTIELLFNEEWLICSPLWRQVQTYRHLLVDSERLYKCLKGYMQGEIRLANGERTGRLGGKRKEAIDKYGFSPKNWVQYYRLAWAGKVYFEEGYFPVNIKKVDPVLAANLLDIKTKPQDFKKEELNEAAARWERTLDIAYNHRSKTTIFNEKIANDLCVMAYGRLVKDAYNQQLIDNKTETLVQ